MVVDLACDSLTANAHSTYKVASTIISSFAAGWVPHCVPGQTDHSNMALRDCVSVLFVFQRRQPQDQQFSEDCMQWLDILVCCTAAIRMWVGY